MLGEIKKGSIVPDYDDSRAVLESLGHRHVNRRNSDMARV
jgi:hypothetical protein